MSPQVIGQLRVALAQVNPTVGDLEFNAQLILEYAAKAATAGGEYFGLSRDGINWISR